ncbi:MAG: SDR family oxidoreductase, partial [Halobacteria archaeon]|nr:SDR family oxidoreductase [Halobacteria archaeon]
MSDKDLSDVTAFITGASRGIGREIATTFAKRGANVSLAARSDGIEETAEIIDDEDSTLTVRTDVTDENSIEQSISETVEEFGGLDCLVNNAGVEGPIKPFDRIDAADWDEVQNVNVRGAFLCAKHSASHLRESEQASIVNISSIGGKRPYPNRSPYAASKMALIGLTRTLAFELGE